MAAITDGTFTSPVQDGDKQVSFPYDFLGDSYARMVARPYVQLSSSYSQPRTLTTNSVTNYLTYSEQFDNAAWTKTNVTISANALANPASGEANADSMLETVTAAGHNLERAYTFTAVSHCLSVFLRANG